MIGPVPARSTYAARSRAQVNAAPLTKTRHTHTQTTREALLLGQDETDPEQKKKKKLLLFIPRNGATLLVSTDDNKPSSKQTLQRRTVCR